MSAVFNKSLNTEVSDEGVNIEGLYSQIGQLKGENDFINKKWDSFLDKEVIILNQIEFLDLIASQ